MKKELTEEDRKNKLQEMRTRNPLRARKNKTKSKNPKKQKEGKHNRSFQFLWKYNDETPPKNHSNTPRKRTQLILNTQTHPMSMYRPFF